MPTEIKVKLSHVSVKFFVRVATDQDRVSQFADRYIGEGIRSLPLIKVARDTEHTDLFHIIEGRTRYESMQLVNTLEPGFFDEIDVELLPPMSEIEYRFLAIKENAGGAMPPTTSDINKSVMDLLRQGVSRAKIISELGKVLGQQVVVKACNYAQSQISRTQMERAIASVNASEMTVAQAAKHYGVSPDSLKRKHAGELIMDKPLGAEIKSDLAIKYRLLNQKVGAEMRKLNEALMDGTIKEEDVADVLKFVETAIARQQNLLQNWRDRGYEMGVGQEKTKHAKA